MEDVANPDILHPRPYSSTLKDMVEKLSLEMDLDESVCQGQSGIDTARSSSDVARGNHVAFTALWKEEATYPWPRMDPYRDSSVSILAIPST